MYRLSLSLLCFIITTRKHFYDARIATHISSHPHEQNQTKPSNRNHDTWLLIALIWHSFFLLLFSHSCNQKLSLPSLWVTMVHVHVQFVLSNLRSLTLRLSPASQWLDSTRLDSFPFCSCFCHPKTTSMKLYVVKVQQNLIGKENVWKNVCHASKRPGKRRKLFD